MPSNLNDRVPRDQAKIPNVRNWAVRDYGNRIGIWRLMEVLSRYGIRASAALNSEVCDHHPEIIEKGGKLGWEWIGHNQTNAMRLTEMDPAAERAAIRATIDRIEAASGTRPVGWLGAGLAETWNTLDYLAEAGIRYVCDWVRRLPSGNGGTTPIVSFDKAFGGLPVLCTQAGDVNAERGAFDHPPFSLDHHPVCGMGAAQHEGRQRIAGAREAQLIKLVEGYVGLLAGSDHANIGAPEAVRRALRRPAQCIKMRHARSIVCQSVDHNCVAYPFDQVRTIVRRRPVDAEADRRTRR